MKRLHTLGLTLCMLCACTLITAQQASTIQDNFNLIIIKKKIDANGQQTLEKVIVTNDDEEEAMARLEAENAPTSEVFVVNGNCTSAKNLNHNKICTTKNANRNVMVHVDEENGEKIITIDVDGEMETLRLAKGEELSNEDKMRLEEKGVFLNHANGVTRVGKGPDHDFDFDFDLNLEGLGKGLVHLNKELAHLNHGWAVAAERSDINCAALGVYVSTSIDGGVYVNSTIGASGAEEAGLTRGDVIKYIDDAPTANYRELHDALAKHEPGDVVTVTYTRDGAEDRVETQLRAWRDFPSFANSRHALITCGEDPVAEETVTRKIIVIKKDKVEEPVAPVNQSPIAETIDNHLDLSDFVAFPNPSDGKFNVQFTAEAKPTVVSVYDAAGKEIFRDNVDNFNGYYNREINLTSNARGGVVLSVEQDGKTFTEQIVLH